MERWDVVDVVQAMGYCELEVQKELRNAYSTMRLFFENDKVELLLKWMEALPDRHLCDSAEQRFLDARQIQYSKLETRSLRDLWVAYELSNTPQPVELTAIVDLLPDREGALTWWRQKLE